MLQACSGGVEEGVGDRRRGRATGDVALVKDHLLLEHAARRLHHLADDLVLDQRRCPRFPNRPTLGTRPPRAQGTLGRRRSWWPPSSFRRLLAQQAVESAPARVARGNHWGGRPAAASSAHPACRRGAAAAPPRPRRACCPAARSARRWHKPASAIAASAAVSRRSCMRSISAMFSSSSAVWRAMHRTIGRSLGASATPRGGPPGREIRATGQRPWTATAECLRTRSASFACNLMVWLFQ